MFSNLRSDLGSIEKFHIVCTSLSFAVFSIIIKISGFSIWNLVNIQNTLVKIIFLQTSGMGTGESIVALISPFFLTFIAFLFFVLGLAFLSSYGYYKNYRNVGLISSIIGAIISVIIFNFSIVSFFVAAGMILSSLYIIPLANTYSKELKKWVLFRTGSNSISKAMLVFNIVLAVGIFFAVFSNLGVYSTNFKQEMDNAVTSIAMSSIPSYQMNDQMKEQLKTQIADSIDKSPIFGAYFRWLPLTSAISIWIVLEFLKSILFSNIGGLLSKICIKAAKNMD